MGICYLYFCYSFSYICYGYTVKCQRRKADVTMRLFKESQSIQYLQHYGRLSDKAGFLKFSAAGVNITEMEFMGYKSDEVILQYNPARDSLNFWIQSRYRVGDTLLLRLDYMKTDSTGVLAPFHENLTMGMPSDTNLLAAIAKKEQDTVFLMKVTAKDDTFEYEGITIEMPDPVAEFHADSIRFIETNPRNQTTDALLKMERDTSDIRIFRLLPQDSIKVGYNYELVIPRGTFTDIYGLENQEANTKLSIPQNEELSSITLNLTGIDTRYIVELVDEKMTVVHRRFTLDEDRVIICKYLKAGKYALRITRDDNRNGFFDTGNLLEKRQPEMVIIYRFSDGLEVMTLPERTDVEQDINITELFTL